MFPIFINVLYRLFRCVATLPLWWLSVSRILFVIFDTPHKLQLPEIWHGTLRLRLKFSDAFKTKLSDVFCHARGQHPQKVVSLTHSVSVNLDCVMEYCLTQITMISAQGIRLTFFSACWDEPEITRTMFIKRTMLPWCTFQDELSLLLKNLFTGLLCSRIFSRILHWLIQWSLQSSAHSACILCYSGARGILK